MKNIIMTLAAVGGLASTGFAELKWLTDFEAGKKAAAEQNKKLLVDFTGSDWCGWCIKLKEEVFSKPEFEKVADDYVLVELDFPQNQNLITAEQRGINKKVAEEFDIQGYPTILLLDSKGRPFARTGYQEGGPEKYLAHLDDLSKPLDALAKTEGEDRAKVLSSFLKGLEGIDLNTYYAAEIEELKKLDPEDKLGVFKSMDYAKALAEHEKSIGALLQSGDFDEVHKMVNTFLEKNDPKGEDRQHIIMGHVIAYVENNEKDKAFATLDELATLAPESEIGKSVTMLKENITKHLANKAAAEKAAETKTTEEEKAPKE